LLHLPSSLSHYTKNCPFTYNYILQLQTIKVIQGRNSNIGTQKHICGGANNQKTIATTIASILSTRKVHALIEDSSLLQQSYIPITNA